MTKGQIAAYTLVLLAGLSYFFKDDISEAYLDYKAQSLTGKCYVMLNPNSIQPAGAVALQEYDAESNMFTVEGFLDMQIIQLPFQGQIPRAGALMGVEDGSLSETACAKE